MCKAILTLLVSFVAAAPNNLDFTPLNEFSLRLLDNTWAYQNNFDNQNIAISPLSVWNIFSLIAEGSSGQTFRELTKELRLPSDVRATQALHLQTSNLLKRDHQDVILKGQSAMFADNTLQIHQEFCEAANSYNTDIYSVDPKNTTELANKINYYVCLATDGRIRSAVKPENLENLRLILVDALYFKANWTYPFDTTATKRENFYSPQGKSIGEVNMMYHKAPHGYADSDTLGAQVLEMNYGKNEDFAMLILLPYEGVPIKKVLANLASQPLSWMKEIRVDMEPPGLDCYIPRFKISSRMDLIPPLQYTGIQSIFNVEAAQLPGISDSPLFITSTVQNVELEVTEEGTVAASSTVVGLEDRILGQRFEANREFVYLITERRTNLILFAGVYVEPSLV